MATDANSPISTNYSVGIHNVGSYQVAGAPWITGSILDAATNSGSSVTYTFPMVAKKVTVKICAPGYVYGGGLNTNSSSPIYVSFGELKDSSGTSRLGRNAFNSVGDAAGTPPPLQFSRNHTYVLQYVSASAAGPNYGQEITFDTKTTHVNIMCASPGGFAVTGAFHVFAELTNIPTDRMWMPSGSGINSAT